MQGSTRPSESCEWCNFSGLITVYHREYRGHPTIHVEHVDRFGEIHTQRVPGTLAAHCSCALGSWMRDRLDIAERRRFPLFSDVINGRSAYVFERPDLEDDGGISDEARTFIRRWIDGFGGQPLPEAGKPKRVNPEDAAHALHERSRRIEMEGAK